MRRLTYCKLRGAPVAIKSDFLLPAFGNRQEIEIRIHEPRHFGAARRLPYAELVLPQKAIPLEGDSGFGEMRDDLGPGFGEDGTEAPMTREPLVCR